MSAYRVEQIEDEQWLAIAEFPKTMIVQGDSEAIVRRIMDVNLIWYAERQAAKNQPKLLCAPEESEIVLIEPYLEEKQLVDTVRQSIDVEGMNGLI